jgi:type IV secretory pathway VirD2 relaxase
MATDEAFFLRLGKIQDRGAGSAKGACSFMGEVLAATRRAGLGVIDVNGPRRARRSGRARDAGRAGRQANRRVVIKARIVRHQGARYRAAPMAMHVRYLQRDGVTKDDRPAEMFDQEGPADHRAFAGRCAEDRHHFRFIVSPEDAADLQDLRATTRDLMGQAEHDLCTRLDWIAVDHWNTDNPHVHVLVRGVTQDGADLIIDRDYITRGLRQRAEQLVSLELGPRSQAQIEASLEREVRAERWTGLDRRLKGLVDDLGLVDLRPDGVGGQGAQPRLIGRVETLERLGLAVRADEGWRLADDLEPRLRALGERGDVIRSLNRAVFEGGRGLEDLVIHGADVQEPMVGRLVDRGLHDELSGEAYLLIDGVDGRLHHLRVSDLDATGDTPLGGLVEARRWGPEGQAPRLSIIHRSDLSIERQITAEGATWLDRQLVRSNPQALASTGFGATVRTALAQRRQRLQARRLADGDGRPAPGLIERLRGEELARVARNIADETGRSSVTVSEGEEVFGVYRRRLDLVSGRFAMIDDGLGFQLVPWTRALEPRLDQEVLGTMKPTGRVAWSLGKTRGISL